jgi:hypothetical protein
MIQLHDITFCTFGDHPPHGRSRPQERHRGSFVDHAREQYPYHPAVGKEHRRSAETGPCGAVKDELGNHLSVAPHGPVGRHAGSERHRVADTQRKSREGHPSAVRRDLPLELDRNDPEAALRHRAGTIDQGAAFRHVQKRVDRAVADFERKPCRGFIGHAGLPSLQWQSNRGNRTGTIALLHFRDHVRGSHKLALG